MNPGRSRGDAAATRRGILDAAIAEFSRFGIAGARVERIASASGSSKAMIYAYFHNKESLFDAVFDAIVVTTMDDVPIDASDLPGYAVRLFEQHRRHPEVVRIGAWDELERDGAGFQIDALTSANKRKIDAIRRAQQQGRLSNRLSPKALMELIATMARSGMTIAGAYDDPVLAEERRETIRGAVMAFIDQSSGT